MGIELLSSLLAETGLDLVQEDLATGLLEVLAGCRAILYQNFHYSAEVVSIESS
jgi:hypothetical protein